MLIAMNDTAIRILDGHTGKSLHPLGGHCGSVGFVSFSADGQRIYSVGDTTVRTWDVKTGKETRPPLAETARFGVSMAADRKTLATRSGDSVQFWNIDLGAEILPKIVMPENSGFRAVISPDAKWLLADTDLLVHIWDVSTGKKKVSLPAEPFLESVFSFLPDSTGFVPGLDHRSQQN